jgi:uncharacterized Zn finger protein
VIPAEFGSTPWGRAWVRTVAATAAAGPNALLPKARSLARNHAATLSIHTGQVDAEVTISGVAQQVRLGVPVWSAETQAIVARLAAKSHAQTPGLIAGDLSGAFEADLRKHGISIAVTLAELGAECHCAGRKRPCVHILTVIYALAQRIDERPVLAIELRCSLPQMRPALDPDWVQLATVDAASFYGE